MAYFAAIAGATRGTSGPCILVLLAFVFLAGVRAGHVEAAWGQAYGGVFIGAGFQQNRIVGPDGFANWGRRGWTTDYDDADLVGGPLLGRKFDLNGTDFRIELDGAFGDMSAHTNRVDPAGRDETVRASFRWTATARLGLEHREGPVTIFVNGGVAAARITNTLADIDYFRDMPPRKDPDDSFRHSASRIGWVVGVGIETPEFDAWRLRLDGSYLGFGRSTHHVNRSGNNPCGPGGPREACPYEVENHVVILRLALVRRFDL